MKFNYKAIKGGVVVHGQVDAESESTAISFLKANEYTIISVFRKGQTFTQINNILFGRVTFTEVVDLTRQLAIMLNAGLTIIDALEILKKQLTKPAQLAIVSGLADDIRAGLSLSAALKKHPQQFGSLYISLVRAGEASGKLDEILGKLAENLEKQRVFKSKIRGALIYPVLVTLGMLSVMFIMITFVIPKLLVLYKDLDVDLPFTTQILIALSTFFQAYWPIFIIANIVLVVGILKYFRTKRGKKVLDTFLFKVPKINQVVKTAALVDSTRTLGILIQSGVSITEGLDIIAESSSNILYKEAFVEIQEKIERGESLGRALEVSGLFPPILVQMATVGEETGHLDETLIRLSDFFETESELVTKAMITLIEPLVLVFLGLGVGFIVMSVILPIFTLATSFKQ